MKSMTDEEAIKIHEYQKQHGMLSGWGQTMSYPTDDHTKPCPYCNKWKISLNAPCCYTCSTTRTIDKKDENKPRWSLLPAGTIERIVAVLEFGAKKYQVDNWQGVPDARRRYYDAVMRHVEAWWSGEKNDPETGLPHLAHAATCLLFLMWFDDQEKTMKFRINDLVAAKTNEPKWDMFMITTIDYEHMKIGYYSTDKGVDVFHNVDDVRMIAQWWDDEDA